MPDDEEEDVIHGAYAPADQPTSMTYSTPEVPTGGAPASGEIDREHD